MPVYTYQQIINIAKVSQYLVANARRKGGLYGGSISTTQERKIYMVRKNVEWLYDLDNNDSTLPATTKLLYALCAPFNQEAAIIAQAGGGGSVSPINPSTTPDRLDFVVSDTSFIATGESSKVITAFKGFNIVFARNGSNESEVDNGGTYFTWQRISGLFTIFGMANEGETFSIIPV